MISIVIPTFNNLEYLKLCINSLKKNSKYSHDIRLHINDGSDGTLDFANTNNIFYTHSNNNIGLCSSINLISSTVTSEYLLYAHDDMYFCPNWDDVLIKEVKSIGHNSFYLSGTMIEPNSAHISFDCGDTPVNFDENKLIDNLHNLNFYDHQGSHFAPHLVEKKLWDSVGGFSEEFNPGMASDPDFNMKLWNKGVRIFKGINDFKVYHFGSIVTRKYKNHPTIKTESGSRGAKIFLLKWGITIKFFKKFILNSDTKYLGELTDPKKDISYLLQLTLCKLNYLYTRYIYNINNKHNLI